MLDLWRGRLAMKYIFFEMLPVFIIGTIVFNFIILMFQSIRLTEYVLIHGASLAQVGAILVYMGVGMLPVILPMSLLFAILLTYGRLSSDSEIVAMKALGLSMRHIAAPGLILAALVTALSGQSSYYLAPWGNTKMDDLVNQLSRSKPIATIREGVFSEGFFDLVVYANRVNSENGGLEKVFIYDERNPKSPLTIIAKSGQLVQEALFEGNKAFLRLFNGNIHRTNEDTYTKINFTTYDISLFDPHDEKGKERSPFAFTMDELVRELETIPPQKKRHNRLLIEYHRRGAITFACILFGLLGVGLGTVTNRRQGRGSGFVMSLFVIVAYWLTYGAFETMAKNRAVPPSWGVWATNLLLLLVSLWALRRSLKT